MVLWFVPLIAAGIKTLAVCACVGGTCYCAKKAHDAWKQGQKTKQKNIERKSRADELKIQTATEDNKKIDAEENEWKKKYEEREDREKQLDKEIEELKQANKGNLSEEERNANNLKIIALQDELDGIRNDKKSILDKIKELTKRRDKNNQIINSTGLGLVDDERHWVWQFLTLENILIMLAIYAVWKIVRDEQR